MNRNWQTTNFRADGKAIYGLGHKNMAKGAIPASMIISHDKHYMVQAPDMKGRNIGLFKTIHNYPIQIPGVA